MNTIQRKVSVTLEFADKFDAKQLVEAMAKACQVLAGEKGDMDSSNAIGHCRWSVKKQIDAKE